MTASKEMSKYKPFFFVLKFLFRSRKKYKSQVWVKIQAGGETFEIHKRINSIWNREELPDQWKPEEKRLLGRPRRR
jgi:hypothetical protein